MTIDKLCPCGCECAYRPQQDATVNVSKVESEARIDAVIAAIREYERTTGKSWCVND